MKKTHTVADGNLVLTLTPDTAGGFSVTSPLYPELVTEAETIQEAFAMAYDALKSLTASRAKVLRKLAKAS
ncbi:MAG TPA: type II toxin-antitoxin system HicB family antitoxin [bacterium]|nr:type II toxin-antitoxin system HicB family antitoxin [bacterium]